MQRYIVSGSLDRVHFEESDIHHIVNVMRLHKGDTFEINLNGSIYLVEITNNSPFEIKVIREIEENRELNNKVVLFYCLGKGDKPQLVIQKATELGVDEIHGVISKRTIVKVEEKDKAKKIERYQKIMKEASEQSKRNKVPAFVDIIDYKDIFNLPIDHKFIAYENESLKNNSLFLELEKIKKEESIGIIIGPEGGFEESEVELAKRNGYKAISLGKRILRNETASIYAISVISFMMERE